MRLQTEASMEAAAPRLSEQVMGGLADRAEASEQARHLAGESVEVLREAGYLRALVPRSAGGFELDFASALELVRGCFRGHASAAWVLMVSTAHDWIVGSFPEEAQKEVFDHVHAFFQKCRRHPAGC